ncbi:hypothetical protein ACTXT7_011348 [Hymenolepis weldensis]
MTHALYGASLELQAALKITNNKIRYAITVFYPPHVLYVGQDTDFVLFMVPCVRFKHCLEDMRLVEKLPQYAVLKALQASTLGKHPISEEVKVHNGELVHSLRSYSACPIDILIRHRSSAYSRPSDNTSCPEEPNGLTFEFPQVAYTSSNINRNTILKKSTKNQGIES